MKFNIPFFPMLLNEVRTPFDSDAFLYEIKFDGIRALLHISKNEIHIYNRHKKEITNLYPELISLKNMFSEEYIFDGEIVLFDEVRPSFSKLQERSHLKNKEKIKYYATNHPVCFIAFDLLYKRKDITNLLLIERKKILEKIPDTDYFIKAKFILKNGTKLFKEIKKLNLEGMVAKEIESTYEQNTRSHKWLKIKNYHEETFYIGGYFDEASQPMIKLFLGEYKNNNFHFVGKVMLGKKNAIYKKIKLEKPKEKTPFCDYNEKEVIYLNPKLTCQILYTERTKNNHLRQPIFKNDSQNAPK